MTENMFAKDEIKRRLIIFLRIPTEVWTDVLKINPRSILVNNIAPACFRLKEICDKNVKTVHLIKKAYEFNNKLKADNPEATKQLEHLAGHTCHLADQFRLISVFTASDEKSKHVLRHSLDLLQGCRQLSFFTREQSANNKIVFLDECLTHLESTKPFTIEIEQMEELDPDNTFWLNPTVLECGRVMFNVWEDMSDLIWMKTYMAVSHWLHHRPMECNYSAAHQQVRCMAIWLADHNQIDWLLNRCSEKLQRSQQPSDRRSYVFNFVCEDWSDFGQFHRVENKATGEVLMLEQVMNANGQFDDEYRLRRCLAEEEASGAEFYAEIFNPDSECSPDEKFNIGNWMPKVLIH